MTPSEDTTSAMAGEWTEAERASLRRMLRYAVAIFTAIGITLLIVGVLAATFRW